jgi:aspartyl protease family protein
LALTYIHLDVGTPPNPDHWQRVRCLVDSGAIYTVVPAALLQSLGIEPTAEEEFELANRETITRRKGIAAFRYEGRVGGADVIFGEEGDAHLLGAFTLEALGLALDPLRRELRPLRLLIASRRPR